MKEELKACPICGSTALVDFMQAGNRYNPDDVYMYVRCQACDMVLLRDREDNKDFTAYNLNDKPSRAQQIVMALFYRRLRAFRRSGRVLNFGAGSGNLSRYLADRGYQVDSFEVDETSKKWMMERRGLSVVEEFGERRYDVIIMEQVLEHLPDPVGTLKRLSLALKDDGYIFLSIPNINSLQARYFKAHWFHLDAPRHINHFFGKSFFTVMEKAQLIVRKTHYFNFHIDSTGWCWSVRGGSMSNAQHLKKCVMVLLCLPLLLLTTMTRSTGYILYIASKGCPVKA